MRLRAQLYLRNLHGNNVVFTHGGLISAYLHAHGVEEMPSNGSVVGVTIKDNGEAESLEFQWDFPYVEEDI